MTKRVAVFLVLVLAVLIVQWAWLNTRGQPPTVSANLVEEGQMTLTSEIAGFHDQWDRPFDEAGLGEKARIVVFGYTHCPDICPTTLLRVSQALDLLGPDAAQTQAIFVTLDPDRDTPALLREYMETIDSRILGLSGSSDSTQAVAQLYRVYYAKVGEGDDYLLDHSAFIYVVGPNGDLYAYLPHDAEPPRIAEKTKQSLEAYRAAAKSDG